MPVSYEKCTPLGINNYKSKEEYINYRANI